MALKAWQMGGIAIAGLGALVLYQGRTEEPRQDDRPGGAIAEAPAPERPTLASAAKDRIPAPIPTPSAASYSVGQAVEADRSGYWHACRVTSVETINNAPVVRSQCEGLPEYGNIASSEYHTGASLASQLRPATGRLGSDLSIGKITCYDAKGNRDDISFLVPGWGQYTDLWGANGGSFAKQGEEIVFSGGYLDGTRGREFRNDGFKVGTTITCSGHLSS